MSDGRLTLPKLSLCAMTSLSARKGLSEEAYRVLDLLAQRSGVVVERVDLKVKDSYSTFTVSAAPDTVHEVFTHLMAMAPEVHNEEDE